MKTILYTLFIIILIFTNSQAQLTHIFTNTAHINDEGQAWGIVVDSNGTIFFGQWFWRFKSVQL